MFPCQSSSDIYRSNKMLDHFSQLLENLFLPLFEVTIDPSSHPDLHKFITQVGLAYTASTMTVVDCYHSQHHDSG